MLFKNSTTVKLIIFPDDSQSRDYGAQSLINAGFLADDNDDCDDRPVMIDRDDGD